MSEETTGNEAGIDLMGMTPTKKVGGPKPIAGPQINRSRKGSKLTDEEVEERKKRRKRNKLGKAKLEKKKQLLEGTLDIDIINSDAEDYESDWDEVDEDNIEVEDKATSKNTIDDDVYIPEPRVKTPVVQASKPKVDEEYIEVEVEKKPIPPIGLHPTNPINANGAEIFYILDRLYSHIGYFVLSEQFIPTKPVPLKVVYLKLDDGRFITVFIKP